LAGYFPSSKCRCRSLDKGGVVGVNTLVFKDDFATHKSAGSVRSQEFDEFSGIRFVLDSLKPAHYSSFGEYKQVSRGESKDHASKGNSSKGSSSKDNSSKGGSSKGSDNKKGGADGVCPFSQLRGLSAGLFLEEGSLAAHFTQIGAFTKNTLRYEELFSDQELFRHQARAPPYSSI